VQGSDGNYDGVEGAWGWLQREERMKRGRQSATSMTEEVSREPVGVRCTKVE
jgi:hypothetical protein